MKADRGFESRPLRFVTELRYFCDKSPQIVLIHPNVCCYLCMWLGLVYEPSDDGAQIIVCAWTREGGRPFTIGGRPQDVPEIARWLRAEVGLRSLAQPRCGTCDAPLELPAL